MLSESSLLRYVRVEVINTTCYVINCVNVISKFNKIPNELLKDRNPKFILVTCVWMLLLCSDNGKYSLENFDYKFDEEIFLR